MGTPEVLSQSVDLHPSFQLLNFIIFSELHWTYAAGSTAAGMAVLVCLAVCPGSPNKEKERARLYMLGRSSIRSQFVLPGCSNFRMSSSTKLPPLEIRSWCPGNKTTTCFRHFFNRNSLKLTILSYAKIFGKRQPMSRARGKCDSLSRIFWNFQQMFF